MTSRVLLAVASEGGSLSLERELDGTYCVKLADLALTFIDEGGAIRRSAVNLGWEQAIQQLGRYPWHMLSPLTVAPEVRDLVWGLLASRWSEMHWPHKRERWAELCGRPIGASPTP